MTWPNSYDAAEDHAASLLAIAEGGLVEGCAPARTPDASTFSAGSAIELNKVDRQSIRELRRELDDAVAKWKSAAVCP